jgi:hypothetical protein
MLPVKRRCGAFVIHWHIETSTFGIVVGFNIGSNEEQ